MGSLALAQEATRSIRSGQASINLCAPKFNTMPSKQERSARFKRCHRIFPQEPMLVLFSDSGGLTLRRVHHSLRILGSPVHTLRNVLGKVRETVVKKLLFLSRDLREGRDVFNTVRAEFNRAREELHLILE